MHWSDEGYLLSKNNYDENSIIIEVFTQNHGKCSGLVYGGSSRKNKKIFQIGNKIFINWKSRGENKSGYFSVELIEPISPYFFDDKKRSMCILSSSSILKILLPEQQINKKIYNSYSYFLNNLYLNNWIFNYIRWEVSLIKELGYDINILNKTYNIENDNFIQINDKTLKIPKMHLTKNMSKGSSLDVKHALNFNKELLIENFIHPNRLRFPLFRNILEGYFK